MSEERKRRRDNESPETTERRHQADAELHRHSRRCESLDETMQRRESDASRHQQYRASLSQQQVEQQRRANSASKAPARALLTPEERALQLERDRLRELRMRNASRVLQVRVCEIFVCTVMSGSESDNLHV
jgi:hypothetical protein